MLSEMHARSALARSPLRPCESPQHVLATCPQNRSPECWLHLLELCSLDRSARRIRRFRYRSKHRVLTDPTQP